MPIAFKTWYEKKTVVTIQSQWANQESLSFFLISCFFKGQQWNVKLGDVVFDQTDLDFVHQQNSTTWQDNRLPALPLFLFSLSQSVFTVFVLTKATLPSHRLPLLVIAHYRVGH